jgi:hypothetical protein
VRQSKAEALDEAARFTAPVFAAWNWDWAFGALQRPPDVLDIRRKLDELTAELEEGLEADSTQQLQATIYEDHLVVFAVRLPNDDIKFDVHLVFGDGWYGEDAD